MDSRGFFFIGLAGCGIIMGVPAVHADSASIDKPVFTEIDEFMGELSGHLPALRRCVEVKTRLLAQVAKIPGEELQIAPPPVGHYYPAKASEICEGEFSVGKAAQELYFTDSWVTRRYYQCQALAVGNPSRCGMLASVKRDAMPNPSLHATAEQSCTDLYFQAALAKLLITKNPQAMNLCRELCQESYLARPIEGSSQECVEMCRLMVDNRDDPGALCAKAGPQLWRSATLAGAKDCRDGRFLLMFGLQKDCDALMRELHRPNKDDDIQGSCTAHAVFKKAYEARRLEFCEDDPICRVMMGAGAASCDAYARRLRSKFCDGQQAKLAQDRKRQRALEMRDRLASIRVKSAQLEATCMKAFDESLDLSERIRKSLGAKRYDTPEVALRRKRVEQLQSQRRDLRTKFGGMRSP